MTSLGIVEKRLAALKKEQAQQAKHQNNYDWYAFVARPTCPPSTSIVIQGGTCIASKANYNLDTWGYGIGSAWTVPNLVKDLADSNEAIVDMGWQLLADVYDELTWTQANTYRGGILLLCMPPVAHSVNPAITDWKLRLHCYQEEYGSPGEAEGHLIAWLNDESVYDSGDGNYWPDPTANFNIYQESGMPLCGIILRNNGILGTGRYFMEIDAMNRGRSYTWPRDMRPQWIALY